MSKDESDSKPPTTHHVENVSVAEKDDGMTIKPAGIHGHLDATEEEVLGRDFTMSDSELPPGYFTSAKFVGSSM